MTNSLHCILKDSSTEILYPSTNNVINLKLNGKEISIIKEKLLNQAHIIQDSQIIDSLQVIDCEIQSLNITNQTKTLIVDNSGKQLLFFSPIIQHQLNELQLVSCQIKFLDFTYFPKIEYLNVSQNIGFKSSLPSSLIRLEMKSCGLTKINFKQLLNLQQLDISDNPKLDIYKNFVPKSLQQFTAKNCSLSNINLLNCQNLEIVDLSNNKFKFIIVNDSSAYIILNSNQLEYVPYAPNCCLDYDHFGIETQLSQKKIKLYIDSKCQYSQMMDSLGESSQIFNVQVEENYEPEIIREDSLQLQNLIKEVQDEDQQQDNIPNAIFYSSSINKTQNIIIKDDIIQLQTDVIIFEEKKLQIHNSSILLGKIITINTQGVNFLELVDCNLSQIQSKSNALLTLILQNQNQQLQINTKNFTHIIHLELFQCGLQDIDLKFMVNLEFLNLGANPQLNITNIPSSVKDLNLDDCDLKLLDLTNLNLLNLSTARNQGIQFLNNYISKNLKTLNVQGCNLQEINLLNMPNLQQCDLSYNKLTYIIINSSTGCFNITHNELNFIPYAPNAECIYFMEKYLEIDPEQIKDYIQSNGVNDQFSASKDQKIGNKNLSKITRSIAYSYMYDYNYDKALELFQQSLNFDFSINALSGRTECYFQMKNYERALKDSKELYYLDKDNIQNLERLDVLYLNQRNFDELLKIREQLYNIEATSANREKLHVCQRILNFRNFQEKLIQQKQNRFKQKYTAVKFISSNEFKVFSSVEMMQNFDKLAQSQLQQITLLKSLYIEPEEIESDIQFAKQHNILTAETITQIQKYRYLSSIESEEDPDFQDGMELRQRSLKLIEKNDIQNAIVAQIESLNKFIMIKQECQIAISYCNLAELYKRNHDFSNFIKYIFSGYVYNEANVKICLKAGNFHFDMLNYQISQEWYKKSLQLKQDSQIDKLVKQLELKIALFTNVDYNTVLGADLKQKLDKDSFRRIVKKELAKWHPDRSTNEIEKAYFSWRFTIIQDVEQVLQKQYQ